MHSLYRKFHGRATFVRLLTFLKPIFHDVRRTLQLGPKVEACFCLSGGKHHSADCCKILPVWTEVVLPRRSLGEPEASVRGVTASGGGEPSATTVTTAVPGYPGASGRSQRMVRAAVADPTVAVATAVIIAASASAATPATVTTAIAATVTITAAATAIVTAATIVAAAAADTVTAATASTACCPGAG